MHLAKRKLDGDGVPVSGGKRAKFVSKNKIEQKRREEEEAAEQKAALEEFANYFETDDAPSGGIKQFVQGGVMNPNGSTAERMGPPAAYTGHYPQPAYPTSPVAYNAPGQYPTSAPGPYGAPNSAPGQYGAPNSAPGQYAAQYPGAAPPYGGHYPNAPPRGPTSVLPSAPMRPALPSLPTLPGRGPALPGRGPPVPLQVEEPPKKDPPKGGGGGKKVWPLL